MDLLCHQDYFITPWSYNAFGRAKYNAAVPEFFDPASETPEGRCVVLVDARTLRQAEKLVIGCEHCSPDDSELPFVNLLDRVTGNNPENTDYLFVEAMAKCPTCRREINEKTLVETSE